MDRVSVIIPTYNREATLIRAVKSALLQTHAVHEILVCDDGSSDRSQQMVQELNNTRIRWINCGRNGLPSVPRNRGIQQAKGDWIAFLDSDDEWSPEKTRIQLSAMKKDHTQASSSNAFRIKDHKNTGPYLQFPGTRLSFSDLLSTNYNICSSVIISRELLNITSVFPEEPRYRAIEDYALWLRISLRTDFSFISSPLLNYQDDPQSSLRVDDTDAATQRQIILNGFSEWVQAREICLTEQQQEVFNKALAQITTQNELSWLEKIKKKISKR